jgi:hypothetical protein
MLPQIRELLRRFRIATRYPDQMNELLSDEYIHTHLLGNPKYQSEKRLNRFEYKMGLRATFSFGNAGTRETGQVSRRACSQARDLNIS